MSALRKHMKAAYPFALQSYVPLGVNLPKSACLYLGISPMHGKHVVVKFRTSSKSWEAGQFQIMVNASTEYRMNSTQNPFRLADRLFDDGYYSLSHALLGKQKIWCLLPNAKPDDRLTTYWSASNYESEPDVLQEAILDSCLTLEPLFREGGYIA